MQGHLNTDHCIYCRQPKDKHFPTCPVMGNRCPRCGGAGFVLTWSPETPPEIIEVECECTLTEPTDGDTYDI